MLGYTSRYLLTICQGIGSLLALFTAHMQWMKLQIFLSTVSYEYPSVKIKNAAFTYPSSVNVLKSGWSNVGKLKIMFWTVWLIMVASPN